jgi:hypothetical protein
MIDSTDLVNAHGSNTVPQEPDDVVTVLKHRIGTLLHEIQQLEGWRIVTNQDSDPILVRAILREVYREVALYQPDVIEATIAVIGQFPRRLDAKRVRAMLVHQAEEWDHGEMALRDFVALGGSEEQIRKGPMTPTAFATAAFWRMLAHKRLCFGYLGALYLFEGLTPVITAMVKPLLRANGVPDTALEYIDFHSTEDVRHATIIDAVIRNVVDVFPDAVEHVMFGFAAFKQVYPIPGWNAALIRAQESPNCMHA